MEDKPKVNIVFHGSQKLIPDGKEIVPGQPWATRDEVGPIKPKEEPEAPKPWWHKWIGWFVWFG